MYKLKLLHRSKRAISAQFIVAVIFLSLSNQLNAVETKVNILTLPVTVIDKKGEPVKGIPHNLFTVIVDKIPYEIEELREDKNLPVNLTIALNVSSESVAAAGVVVRGRPAPVSALAQACFHSTRPFWASAFLRSAGGILRLAFSSVAFAVR